MVETRGQEKRREDEARLQAEQTGAPSTAGEEEASSRGPQSSDSDYESKIYQQFCRFMKKFNDEQKAKHKAKKGKKVKILTSSFNSSPATSSSDSESEEDQKTRGRKHKKATNPIDSKIQEVEKKLDEFRLRGKKKRSFTCEDFCDSFVEDKHIKNLPKKFIKFDGLGDPKAYLAMFFAECFQFRNNHRALFRCFPRSLEGLAAQWYREHINPVELKDFNKLINLFIERFISNVEITPTITTLCNMRQRQGENVRDFIQRWRSACNRMKEPISQAHALGLIVGNLSQPLRSLISSAPVKSFIDLAERAECIEIGMENGAFDAVIKKPAGKPAHSVVSSTTPVVKSKQTKATKKATAATASKTTTAPKKQRPGWSYDRKFTPLEQSLEEIMGVLVQRGTLTLPKVSDPPPVMGKFKDQFCKFHRAPGHLTEDCFVLKNIIQDAVDKELLSKEASSSGVLKNPFPAHGDGKAASICVLEVVEPIDFKPLDFFGLFEGIDDPDQSSGSSSSSSSDGCAIPRIFFEPIEEVLPPMLSSPPRPNFKVNTSNPFRIKQERFGKDDIWKVGWYACQPIIFTDDDLPAGGMHTSALHLQVICMQFSIAKVLVDGGASVNVCPLRTIQELGIRRERFEPTAIDISGFDGHSQTPLGKVTLPVSVVHEDRDHLVEFHIIDVDTSYNMLLGRPWIHSQNTVASTLHQMVRWSKGKSVFTAYAEDRQGRPRWPNLPSPAYDIDVPMVHMLEIQKLEKQISQLSIREAASTPILDGMNRLRRELRKHPRGLHLLICAGYQPYKGLGKFDQGITEPVSLPSQKSRKGLGFVKPRRKKRPTYFDTPIKFVKSPMC
ncbi:unnamed protein product [Victoria cruziana]